MKLQGCVPRLIVNLDPGSRNATVKIMVKLLLDDDDDDDDDFHPYLQKSGVPIRCTFSVAQSR